jgi:hypothetical protein
MFDITFTVIAPWREKKGTPRQIASTGVVARAEVEWG